MAFRLRDAAVHSRKSANKSNPVLSSLFTDPDLYDVNIIGADSDSGVGAHKLVLSSISPVFKAMFNHQMKEATTRDIPVAFSQAVMKCLVEFVYLGEVTVEPDTLVPLYAAADHYAIEGLIHVCKECLEQKITITSCFQWYIDSLNWGQLTEELTASCLAFIAKHFSEALSSADFSLLPFEAVLDLLQRSDLVASTEIGIFEGISQWIEGNTSAQSDQIKTLMESVRYPLIAPADLVGKVGPNPHKSLLNYIRALEFHHLPSVDAVAAPQFLPRGKYRLFLTLSPLKASFTPRPSQITLPPPSLSYHFRTNKSIAVLVVKEDCRFSFNGRGIPCESGRQHKYTLKLTNLPSVGTPPGECKVVDLPALSTRYPFAISGKRSSCVLSRAGTEDCTIVHPLPIMVVFQVSCECMSLSLILGQ